MARVSARSLRTTGNERAAGAALVRYRFVGGKGGVGKTTCAAALAVSAARLGRRTLLISTDPAPSAGDALRQRLTSRPRPVKGTAGRLHAVEVDAPAALAHWLAPRRATLEAIALRGTWLDQDDVAGLLGLSLPGIDEIAALMEIARLGRSGEYDLLVVDTAPTGHTLRMLAMPWLLRTFAAVFDRMQAKHRALAEALSGRWTPDDSDALIQALDEEGRTVAALLRDRATTAMTWVTHPEPMSIAETSDALRELRQLGMHVDALIINRLTPTPDRRCKWCSARRAFERKSVQTLLAGEGPSHAGVRIATVESRATEPQGLRALAAIAAEIARPPRLPRAAAARLSTGSFPRPSHKASVELPVDKRLSLLMFGGKGGVGKTTCAAAEAVTAAAARRSRPVLLVSVDPAHSLGDVLGAPVGDEPRHIAGVPPNLSVRELDASRGFDLLKRRYRSAIDELFERLVRGSAVNVASDRQAVQDLMELAPPGLDELIAIVEVGDAVRSDSIASDTLVVLDTAPSGHALRLLEMPAIVHDWVKALMSILLKYQPIVGIGELGAVLLQMSQGLGRLRTLLADPSRAAFLVVTRPAALPAAETTRLVERLRALGIHVPAVLVNAVGAGTCGRCAVERRGQQRALATIRRTAHRRARAERTTLLAPAIMPPPHGPLMLREWRRSWAEGS